MLQNEKITKKGIEFFQQKWYNVGNNKNNGQCISIVADLTEKTVKIVDFCSNFIDF